MRLILIGPPASGKGTQAELLRDELKLAHLSTGDMLRSAVAQGTELGKLADGIMKSGALVPDDLVISLVKERLGDRATAENFLLDGFPRTLAQAEALQKMLDGQGLGIDKVVMLEVPDDLVIKRITGRRSDPQTGKIYHLIFNPPPADVAGRVVQRQDDTEEAAGKRLAKYYAETRPVVPFYESRGLVTKIDGTPAPKEVFQKILGILR
jgi:adenylate kinase